MTTTAPSRRLTRGPDDQAQCHRVSNALEAGTVWINQYNILHNVRVCYIPVCIILSAFLERDRWDHSCGLDEDLLCNLHAAQGEFDGLQCCCMYGVAPFMRGC